MTAEQSLSVSCRVGENPKAKESKMRAVLLTVLLCTLPGTLYADKKCTESIGRHRIREPAVLHVKVDNGQIMERSPSGALRGTATLKSDLIGRFSCPEKGVTEPTVIVKSMGYKETKTAKPAGQLAVMFKKVPLATADQLVRACGGSKSAKRHDIKVRLQATCGSSSTAGKRCNVKWTDAKMRLYVTCSGSAAPAKRAGALSTVRAVRWLHTCPAGLVVPGTGKRTAELDHANPISCKRP
jgi:hypothetical protein